MVVPSFLLRPCLRLHIAFMALVHFRAFWLTPVICSWKVRLWSSVTPSSFSESTVGISALLSLIPSGSFHSLLQVEKSIEAHFPVETKSCFFLRYGESSSRYRFMRAPASFLSVLCAYMVISSAYMISFTCSSFGCGMSCKYHAKSVGERTLPCGTPVLITTALDTTHRGPFAVLCLSDSSKAIFWCELLVATQESIR